MHARKGPVFRGWLAKWACCLASTVGMALPRTQNKRHAPPPPWSRQHGLEQQATPAACSRTCQHQHVCPHCTIRLAWCGKHVSQLL